MTITVTETMLQCTGIGLRVAAGDTWTFSIVDLKFECPEKAWFFENPPSRCAAEPAIYSRAAVQYFEHGFMVWTETPDRFYVFFDEGVPEPGFQQFIFWDAPYTFVTPEPVDATPPDGYYAPVSGFGRVWRGELQWGSIDVSELLGWATAPEFEFEAVYQCEIQSHPHIWTCYLRGPDGVVLSLGPDSSAMVRYLWQRR